MIWKILGWHTNDGHSTIGIHEFTFNKFRHENMFNSHDDYQRFGKQYLYINHPDAVYAFEVLEFNGTT